jgi:membrane protease YdiL (CAAX protease family)
MNAAVIDRRRVDRGLWETAAVAAGGAGLLVARLAFSSAGSAEILALFALYLGLGAVSVVVTVERDAKSSAPSLGSAVFIGLAAVVLMTAFPASWPHLTAGSTAVALAVVAAVAEEAFFRRLLYGRLLPHGAAVAVAASALLFALVHVPAYGMAAFPVDLGAGLLLSWQRWASGDWKVPAATHAALNLVGVFR